MRIASVGHAVFAATILALGIIGLMRGNFVPLWDPVGQTFPARAVLVYVCAIIPLVTGAGLFWRRSAAVSSRVLFGWFVVWLVTVRLWYLVTKFGVNTWWATAQICVMTGAAWVLYVWFVDDRDAARFPFITGNRGLRISRALFGIGLIPFGLAHFLYMNNTAPLIPAWIPWHVPLGYATGATFIAAGLACITGIQGRLAALLTTLQIAGFTLIVWLPIILRGGANPGQWNEFIMSVTLTAAAWMVTDGYRGVRWT